MMKCSSILVLLMALFITVHGQTSESTDFEEETEVVSNHVPKFLTESLTITVREGETVVFPCRVDDIGTFSTVWQKGNQVLFADYIRLLNDNHYVRQDDRSIMIKKIRAVDAGIYTCIISSNPRAELIHHLHVLTPPRVNLKPEHDLVIKKGTPFYLSCESHGNPTPAVTWKKLDGVLPSGKPLFDGYKISVNASERTHSGTYECMASNGVGDPVSKSVRVQILYAPVIEIENNWVHSGEGVSAELSCVIHADPPATVTWKKGQTMIKSTDDRYRTRQSGNRYTLQIRKVTVEDFGQYHCEARNNLGHPKEAITVSGLASPVIFRSNPIGHHPDSYSLKWVTNSYSKVIEYLLKIREIESDEDNDADNEKNGTEQPWTEVHIPAESQPGLVQTQTYDITGLKPATSYEAVMTVHNTHGWNMPDEAFEFSTDGKAMTTTMSLVDSPVMDEEQGDETSLPSPNIVEAHPQNSDEDGNGALKNGASVAICSLLTAVIFSIYF